MSLSSQDISVYELALNHPIFPPLQLSPSTLKAAIAGLVDLLIEQRLSVNLFVKLPKTDEWQVDIERYHSTGIDIGMYFFDVAGSQGKQDDHREMFRGGAHLLKHSHQSQKKPGPFLLYRSCLMFRHSHLWRESIFSWHFLKIFAPALLLTGLVLYGNLLYATRMRNHTILLLIRIICFWQFAR